MTRFRGTTLCSAWWLAGLWACGSAALAQDSFDGAAPSARPARPTTQTAPAPAAPPTAATPPTAAARPAPSTGPATTAPTAVDADETQDFGVKPVAQLRPSDQLHAPTPTTVPGGKVVNTRQLAQWMQGQQGQQGKVMLLHAIGSSAHLPNATPAAPASQGGTFDDQVQRDFGAYLEKATAGDKARLLVTYCQGVRCWGSYNAALRAIRLGYTNVHWYRGGMEAWQQAGLPILDASTQSGAPVPREPQRR